jgi:hypothetical protein
LIQLLTVNNDDDDDDDDDDDVRGGGFADDERDDGCFSDSGEDDLHGVLSPIHEPIVEPPLGCEASNHVNVSLCDDEVTYEMTRVVDYDDVRVVPPPSPRTIEILKRLFPDHDPLVSHFYDLRKSHKAVADGGALEGDIPMPGCITIIKKGHIFKDIEALKM